MLFIPNGPCRILVRPATRQTLVMQGYPQIIIIAVFVVVSVTQNIRTIAQTALVCVAMSVHVPLAQGVGMVNALFKIQWGIRANSMEAALRDLFA